MTKNRGPCVLCGNPAHEDHHAYPVAFGGAIDGTTVALCASCHTDVHSTADRVWRRELALEAVEPPRKRKLVWCIHQQHLEFESNGGVAPDARRRIVAHLTEEEQQMARLVRTSGRFRSQEEMIKALIRREAERLQRGG